MKTSDSARPRKVGVLTGTRAEYGLLYWLLRGLREDPAFELQLIVTGTHLVSEFGMTVQEIERDGFPIAERVEMLLASDSEVAVATSLGVGTIGFASALNRLRPDLLVLLGDRFEVLAAATAATVLRIPIAHVHGGEATEGLIDEVIRHAVTKMSHLHFVSMEAYRARICQMGETPDRVFVVGAPGLDHIGHRPLPGREKIEERLGLELQPPVLLITYHPVTLERAGAEGQISELLEALSTLEATFIFTYPNADTDGRVIARAVEAFCKDRRRAALYKSLGTTDYFSVMSLADVMIGNSSSGIIEAPSFKLPAVNIGDRQRGRVRARNVIDCSPDRRAIRTAVDRALTPEFRATLADLVNPYGDGHASDRILRVLKAIEPNDELLKKRFCDWPAPRSLSG